MASRKSVAGKGSKKPDTSKMFAQALEHHQAGRIAEASQIYRDILAVDPNHADSLHLSGMVAHAAGDFPQAETLIGKAIKLQPRADIFLGNLGNVLRAQGKLDEAIVSYKKAIAANPRNATPYSNLGNALVDQGRAQDAVGMYVKALELRPDFYETLFNMALTQRGMGNLDEAIAHLRKAIASHPFPAEAHYTLGQCLLLRGELESGWLEYDWRWKLGEYSWLKNIHGDFTQPQWSGEPLNGRRILIYAEQGMGDSLQFVRYLPDVVARGGQVIFAVHPRLQRVLGVIPGVTLVSLDTIPLPAFDVHSPLLSLPRILGTLHVADIPGKVPYLAAEAERVASWKQKLAAIPGFKVGIAWQGNPNAKIDKGRSPPLAAFSPLAAVPGVTLISLQQRDGLDQLDRLPAGMHVERLGDGIDDVGAFVDTAAIMENLDLVIVSDSAIAHLAGALGRPVWVPLKKIPDWRFLLERKDCPWYPNMTLFRQQSDGDWNGVFVRMSDQLKKNPGAVPPAPTSTDQTKAVATDMPMVPQSWGELIDKITILEIKSEKLTDASKLINVRRELQELITVRERHFPNHAGLAEASAKLKKVNESLWWIEDDIRDCERAKDFGPKFIELARAVYVTNDLRGNVKREINDLLGSTLKEEKSYASYVDDQAAAATQLQEKAKGATNSISLDAEAGSRFSALVARTAAIPRLSIDTVLDRSITAQMLERLHIEKVFSAGCCVLDVAAAKGEALDWLRSKGIKSSGLCLDREVQPLAQSGHIVQVGDDTRLAELCAASVDVIWSHQSLQRSVAPFFTLSEYRRLLPAGGYAYIDVPAPDTVFRQQAVGGNLSLFGQSMWQELFVRAGFTQAWGIELGMPNGAHRVAVWAFLLRAV